MTTQSLTPETTATPVKKPQTRKPRTGQTRAKAKKTHGKTKSETLVSMLSSARGASIAALSERLGWQPHTIRAAISRLRKAGHAIDRQASKAGPVYRILDADAAWWRGSRRPLISRTRSGRLQRSTGRPVRRVGRQPMAPRRPAISPPTGCAGYWPMTCSAGSWAICPHQPDDV